MNAGEIIRQIYDEWGRGNFRAGTELYDPHITLVVRAEFADPGVHTGVEAVRKYMHGFLEPWKELTISANDVREVGDTVLVAATQRGTGMVSGAETELGYFQLWTFRGEKVIRIEIISGEDDAREAAGL